MQAFLTLDNKYTKKWLWIYFCLKLKHKEKWLFSEIIHVTQNIMAHLTQLLFWYFMVMQNYGYRLGEAGKDVFSRNK